MNGRRLWVVCLAMACLVLLTSCAAGPNPAEDVAGPDGLAGFWLGLWHGFIAPVALIVSLFSDQVNLYEVHNSGGWYNVGFFLGAGAALGGGGRASRGGHPFASKRHRDDE